MHAQWRTEMVVFVRNLQSRLPFNHVLLAKHGEILMKALGVANFDVSVVCVGRKRIKSLNLKYRRRNRETDVLAFPNFENLKPGTLPKPNIPCDFNLGDIFLGMQVIEKDCKEDNKDIDEYLPVLVNHGLCHLLGYTHDTEESLEQMRRKEVGVLTRFNAETGYQLSPLLPETLAGYVRPIGKPEPKDELP